MYYINRVLLLFFTVTFFACLHNRAAAQVNLARNITIHVKKQRLGTVFKTMEDKGSFYFSYNSNLIKADSLVSLDADNWTVKEVLDQMLMKRFEYKDAKGFIILRYAPLQLGLTTEKSNTENREYIITGFVADEQTGKKLPNASVYEKSLLQSAMTDQNGFFELHLKNEGRPVRLTISKELYKDTTITFLNDVQITSRPDSSLFSYVANDDNDDITKTGLGRLLLSTKQQIQAANLRGLVANAPFQASAIPNVSTHGALNGQIINIVSINAIGGYSAGVRGAEMGIIFNLDKGDVQSVQVAGAFNVVGGNVSGVQLSGLYNNVLGNVAGFQFTFLHNSIKRDLSGVQLSTYNHVRGKVSGLQIAILGNIAGKNVSGLQIGAGNIAQQKFEGIQFGIFNFAKKLRGVQLGLINVADTSSGFSFGLINYIRNGYNKLSLSSNETLNANIAIKTGSNNFYTVYTGGLRITPNSKIYGVGMGLGTVLDMGKHLTFNPEISSRYLYEGSWRYTNLLQRLDGNLNIKLGKKASLFGGPSLNFYYSDQENAVKGYGLAQNLQHNFSANQHHSWWVGWNAGFNFF
ncbi:LA_2272 family surface repeat-containing protein [Mucilaginibacter ginsenosidivorax]|uniref:Carboxypeptidase-like regulatory domain-containing protein n=1 Tax=Mucilaginibacter ginsenosidivorax TaxID=862126 RepID=A0A5B8WAR7_9SPHI|nr:carboxypeptidase-like regulatory domain-containing protein [Mucilaginibacter ginsenosidivorax]QEC79258.1 carboxypeptidase-like regulatory domain-containing protein [Mucilaginibacter ginsenosidivorax]